MREARIESGKANATRTIGVTYGFGNVDEITAGRPDAICHRPGDIYPAILRQAKCLST